MAEIICKMPAGPEHEVISVEGQMTSYRRQPCAECPWRVDQAGTFPAEAFRVSAKTAYSEARSEFGCHMSGSEKPVTCAGFLLNGSAYNLQTAVRVIMGRVDPRGVSDGGHELHASYRAMAEANGVEADDPALVGCRP